MIASQLNRSHEGQTLRLPEDKSKAKHRRYLIGDVVRKADHMLVMCESPRGVLLPIPFGTTVEVTP